MTYYLSAVCTLATIIGVINICVRHSTLSANRGWWTGRLLLSLNVNTERKYIFIASAIYLPFVITIPSLSFSGPTIYLTLCLLMMYVKKLLLSPEQNTTVYFTEESQLQYNN